MPQKAQCLLRTVSFDTTVVHSSPSGCMFMYLALAGMTSQFTSMQLLSNEAETSAQKSTM